MTAWWPGARPVLLFLIALSLSLSLTHNTHAHAATHTDKRNDDKRTRDHIDQILLGDLDNAGDRSASSSPLNAEQFREKEHEALKTLRDIYDNKIRPVEKQFKFADLRRHTWTDADIFAKPIVLLVGPWSTGKTTIINYILGVEDTIQSLYVGAEPTTADFSVITYGEQYRTAEGIVLATDSGKPFAPMEKFGQIFLEHLLGIEMPNKLLRNITFIDTPGILENRRQQERGYPYNDVVRWLVNRADLIFVVFDPTKLDVGTELESLFKQVKGKESVLRIILNKADSLNEQELMRVYGALFWSLAPLINVTEPPRIYLGSLWSQPYQTTELKQLLEREEKSLLKDMREIIRNQVQNKMAFIRQQAIRVRIHALMVDSYLSAFRRKKSFFGGSDELAKDIAKRPHHYDVYDIMRGHSNVSEYDLPDPDEYRQFFKTNHMSELRRVTDYCGWRGDCSLDKINTAIAHDIPALLQQFQAYLAPYSPPRAPHNKKSASKMERVARQEWAQARAAGARAQPPAAEVPHPPAVPKVKQKPISAPAPVEKKKIKQQPKPVKVAVTKLQHQENDRFSETDVKHKSKPTVIPTSKQDEKKESKQAEKYQEPEDEEQFENNEHVLKRKSEENLKELPEQKEDSPKSSKAESNSEDEEQVEQEEDYERKQKILEQESEQEDDSATVEDDSAQGDDSNQEDKSEKDESAEEKDTETEETEDNEENTENKVFDKSAEEENDEGLQQNDQEIDQEDSKEQDEEDEENNSKESAESAEEAEDEHESLSTDTVSTRHENHEATEQSFRQDTPAEQPMAGDESGQSKQDCKYRKSCTPPNSKHQVPDLHPPGIKSKTTQQVVYDDEDDKKTVKLKCKYRKSCYATGVLPDITAEQAKWYNERSSELVELQDDDPLTEAQMKHKCKYRKACYQSPSEYLQQKKQAAKAPPTQTKKEKAKLKQQKPAEHKPVAKHEKTQKQAQKPALKKPLLGSKVELDEDDSKLERKLKCKYRTSCYNSGFLPDLQEEKRQAATYHAQQAAYNEAVALELSDDEKVRKLQCKYRQSCYESGQLPDLEVERERHRIAAQYTSSEEKQDGEALDLSDNEKVMKLQCKYRKSCYESGVLPDIAGEHASAYVRYELNDSKQQQEIVNLEADKKTLMRQCKYRKSCYDTGVLPDLTPQDPIFHSIKTESKNVQVAELSKSQIKLNCKYRKSCYDTGVIPDITPIAPIVPVKIAEPIDPSELSETQKKLRCKYRKVCYDTGQLPEILTVAPVSKVVTEEPRELSEAEKKLRCKFRKACYETGELPDELQKKEQKHEKKQIKKQTEKKPPVLKKTEKSKQESKPYHKEPQKAQSKQIEKPKQSAPKQSAQKVEHQTSKPYRRDEQKTKQQPKPVPKPAAKPSSPPKPASKHPTKSHEQKKSLTSQKVGKLDKKECQYRKSCYKSGRLPEDFGKHTAPTAASSSGTVENIDINEIDNEKLLKLKCKFRKSCYDSGVLPDIAAENARLPIVVGANVAVEAAEEVPLKVRCKFRKSCYESGVLPPLGSAADQAAIVVTDTGYKVPADPAKCSPYRRSCRPILDQAAQQAAEANAARETARAAAHQPKTDFSEAELSNENYCKYRRSCRDKLEAMGRLHERTAQHGSASASPTDSVVPAATITVGGNVNLSRDCSKHANRYRISCRSYLGLPPKLPGGGKPKKLCRKKKNSTSISAEDTSSAERDDSKTAAAGTVKLPISS